MQMKEKHLHLADDQLLLLRSGDLPADSSARIQGHLEGCPQCRIRLDELENAFLGFVQVHRQAGDAELPPVTNARARLQARLTELAQRNSENGRRSAGASRLPRSAWTILVGHPQTAVLTAVSLAACLLVAILLHGPIERFPVLSASLGRWEEPNRRLTPGATLPLTRSQVCGTAKARPIPAVPVSLKRKVFEEYGVIPPRPDAYEVDYLITPELGGATDIRNLWPEPYENTVWNAHVKDQLEDRLHLMVCQGDVDLATAQQDISTDWIAAYRKYFHVEMPVSNASSSLTPSRSAASLPLT
jgi:hypothetical protein